MPKTWQEIQSDPNFQKLPPIEQEKVRIAVQPKENISVFEKLSSEQQGDVRNKMFDLYKQTESQIKSEQRKLDQLSYGGFPPIAQKQLDIVNSLKSKQQKIQEDLNKHGIDSDTIKLTELAQSQIEAPRYGRMAAGLVGGVGLPLALGATGVGIPAAAIIGAGTLGALGEMAQTGLQEKRMISFPEAAHAFAVEGGTELGGRAAWKLGSMAISPLIKKTVPAAKDLIEDYAKAGGHFSPSELDDRWMVRFGESISRGSFGANKIWEDFEIEQGKTAKVFAKNIVDDLTDNAAKSANYDLGKEFADAISPAKGYLQPKGRILKEMSEVTTPLYAKFNEMTEGKVRADISSIQDRIRTILVRDKSILSKNATKETSGLIPADARKMFEDVLNYKSIMPFKVDDSITPDFMKLRSKILGAVRNLARDKQLPETYIAELSSAFNDITSDPRYIFIPEKPFKDTKGLGGIIKRNPVPKEAMNLLQNTNSLYRAIEEAKELYFPEALLDKISKNPAKILKEVFPAENPEKIKAYRLALTESVAGQKNPVGQVQWEKLRRAWLERAIENSYTPEGTVKQYAFDNAIEKMGGDKVIKEIFPEKNGIEQINKIRTLFDLISKKAPQETPLIIRSAQMKGVTTISGLAIGGYGIKSDNKIAMAVGGALVIGPVAYAKLATNPTGYKLLVAGLNAKKGSPVIATIAARMVNLLNQIDNRESQKEDIARNFMQTQNKMKSLQKIYGQNIPPTMAEKEMSFR